MSIFCIADTHLSLSCNKPMDIFSGWTDYEKRLEKHWRDLVKPEDTVVIAGDISWAMSLEQAKADFEFLHNLPGTKLISKGNHDYWWTTKKKMDDFLAVNNFDTIKFIHNNSYPVGNFSICATRGWFFEEEKSGQHDEKVFRRELMRLEASLKAAGDKNKLVFLHYPPKYKGYECPEILKLLSDYQVRRCFYGHLHGGSHKLAIEGLWDSIDFRLAAADYLQFKPIVVIP